MLQRHLQDQFLQPILTEPISTAEAIEFENMSSENCFQLLAQLVQKKKVDATVVSSPSKAFRIKVLERLENL